jgi:trypsin-like peptidase
MTTRTLRLVYTSWLGILLVLVSGRQTLAQITTNVLSRVLMIQIGAIQGTSFTIEVDEKQYLITAKHLVTALNSEDTVQIRKDDHWLPVKVKVFRCDDPIDIAVLVPPAQITVHFPLEPTIEGIRLSQDVFFLGFPYGIFSMLELHPIPFIKKAIMSALTNENGIGRIFLDGHNNQGFSGGPIVFRDLRRNNEVYKVAGVISGYRFDITPVATPEKIKREQVKPEDIAQARLFEKDGHLFRLNDTEMQVRFNTGIVHGYSIKHAIDLIHTNPIGPKISETLGR